MGEDKTNFAILGMVGIIAIVGIVALFVFVGSNRVSYAAAPSASFGDIASYDAENAAGKAYYYQCCSYEYWDNSTNSTQCGDWYMSKRGCA